MDYFNFDKNFSLDNKVALITGAGRGIGKVTADLFAQKGADLILVGRSNNVFDTEKEVKKYNRKCISLVYDISVPENIDLIVKKSIDAFGKIDILINNAAISTSTYAVDMTRKLWNEIIDIDLTAQFFLTQAVGKEMIKNKYGKIVNVSSLASVIGSRTLTAYCSAKTGLIGLTRALAIEWAEYNITVNAISPTVVETDMGREYWTGQKKEEKLKRIPMHRFIQPEEVAALIAFLSSNASNMITGINIVMDGGNTLNVG